MTDRPADSGICLIAAAESGAAALARLTAALEATRAVTVILTAPDDSPLDSTVARPLVAMAQQRNVAALIADDVPAARAAGADGVHLSWRPEIEDAYDAARSALGPDAIIGADAGRSRHDAMTLGEAGADYVAFGRTTETDDACETRRALVAWWAEVFVVPVVAFDVGTADEARDLIGSGADFVAVRLPPAAEAGNDAAWASDFRTALGKPVSAA